MRLLFLLFFTLSTLNSCTNRTFPPPAYGGLELNSANRLAVLEEVRLRSELAQSFKGLYRVKVTAKDKKLSQRYIFLLKRPDQLRLDILPLNSAYTLASFTLKNGQATFLNPSEKFAYLTNNFARVIHEVLGFYLQPDELIGIFLGTIESIKSKAFFESALVFQDSDYFWLVNPGSEYWMLNLASKDIEFGHVRDSISKDLKYEVFYTNFVDQGGSKVPAEVRITIPSSQIIIEAKLSTAEVNLDFPDEKFDLKIPEDYAVR
ncbi:MAG: DUF4292 domain-containing protein [Bdellovibrionales bacterium]|nr:DUF4292 domain-containing protein [Bdellovibrionales bacterium]